MRLLLLSCVLATPWLISCMEAPRQNEAAPSEAFADAEKADGDGIGFGGGGAGAPAAAPEAKVARSRDRSPRKKTAKAGKRQAPGRGMAAPVEAVAVAEMEEMAPDDAKESDKGGAPAVTRAWFPETLLFQPSVITDAQGRAEIPVLVPDRLTDWRVLALAHSKDGVQAGAVASFSSRMDAYVDIVVPPFLLEGDRAILPVQVVNTTASTLVRELTVEAEGGTVEGGKKRVTVPARGSKTLYLPLRTPDPGEVSVKATLASEDAVVRTIPVEATGKPDESTWSGNLAGARSKTITVPPEARKGSIETRLTVYPGALAILRSELQAAPGRSSVADDAYALLLAGSAHELGAALGAPIDEKKLRRLRIVAMQRVLRHARSPNPATAALLAEAALAHPKDPLTSRLGERLADSVARAQRPDGTFGGGNGWPLQRLLVATADGMRAIEAGAASGKHGARRAAAARLRARAAFARHLAMVEDPYTAAAVLAAGVVEGETRKELVARVMKALQQSDEGVRWLPVADDVLRADGARPSVVEATALAALALESEPTAGKLMPDLGAYLLAHYRGGAGFGDGRTNLVALSAVARIFKDPMPTRVSVRLLMDGEPVSDVVLEGDKLKTMSGAVARPVGAAGAHEWQLVADPPVPGLGFALTLAWRSPWPAPDDDAVQITVEHGKKPTVGKPTPVTVRATAPGGASMVITQALPAGVEPDRAGLDLLTQAGDLTRYEVTDTQLTLHAPARAQGRSFVITYRVVPTLAGKLSSGPTTLLARGQTIFVPGEPWNIAR